MYINLCFPFVLKVLIGNVYPKMQVGFHFSSFPSFKCWENSLWIWITFWRALLNPLLLGPINVTLWLIYWHLEGLTLLFVHRWAKAGLNMKINVNMHFEIGGKSISASTPCMHTTTSSFSSILIELITSFTHLRLWLIVSNGLGSIYIILLYFIL